MPCGDGGVFVDKLDKPRKYECRLVEVLAAKIGPMSSTAIQGEPTAPLGARIKSVLRQKGPAMVHGCFAERNLYISTRELVRENAYQAQVISAQFGCPVGWSPDAEDEMVKAVLNMHGEEYAAPNSRRTRPLLAVCPVGSWPAVPYGSTSFSGPGAHWYSLINACFFCIASCRRPVSISAINTSGAAAHM